MMMIRGALVYSSAFQFEQKNILIDDGLISGIWSEMEISFDQICNSISKEIEVIDGTGMLVIPGLVDIHLHGAVGCDFCDATANSINKIREYEASVGVTSICPTTMSLSEDRLIEICEEIGKSVGDVHDIGHDGSYVNFSDILGINLEGPFINLSRAGAQNPEYIMNPDKDMFRRLQKASGDSILLVDMAPELPGATEFIDEVTSETANKLAVHVSIAHTDADYDTTIAACEAGADHITHLYNAMPSMDKRNPGPIPAAREHGAYAELIADGVHVHPSMVRLAWDMYGDDRIVLISDSMEATGLDDGKYKLGGQDVIVRGNRARLDSGVIAGSVTNLYECMKTAVIEAGIPVESAVRAATYNPAASIGMEDRCGVIEAGRVADLLIIDKYFELQHVVKRGVFIK